MQRTVPPSHYAIRGDIYMSQDELCYWTATATAAAIARKDVSLLEIVDGLVLRAAAFDPLAPWADKRPTVG
jgi:hypothetical protein